MNSCVRVFACVRVCVFLLLAYHPHLHIQSAQDQALDRRPKGSQYLILQGLRVLLIRLLSVAWDRLYGKY